MFGCMDHSRISLDPAAFRLAKSGTTAGRREIGAPDRGIDRLLPIHTVEALLTRDRDFSLFPEPATCNPFGTLP